MSRRLELALPGLMVPPLTPFNDAGRIEWEPLRKQVDYIIRSACPAAVTVAGVEVQEYQYLSFDERCELIRNTVDFVDGRAPTVVGVSHPSVRQATTLAHLAEELGAAGIQVLIPLRPSGGQATLKEIVEYFEAISRETSLPIVAYHNPGPGADLGPAQLTELARLDAVQAFKESSRNMRHIVEMIESVERPGLARYLTTMEVFLPSLQMGASGGTMPAPAAALGRMILDAYQSGRYEEAVAVQRLFNTFPPRWMSIGGLTAVMKAALSALGLDVGDPYPPFASLSQADRVALKGFLETHTPLMQEVK